MTYSPASPPQPDAHLNWDVREHQELARAHNRLRGDHDQLRIDHDQLRKEYDDHLDPAVVPNPHDQYRPKQAIAALWGSVNVGSVNTGYRKLNTWENDDVYWSEWAEPAPPTAFGGGGYINFTPLGRVVVVRMTWWLIVEQGNSTKEEQLELWINSDNNGRSGVGVFDIATDKTSVRSFSGSSLIELQPDRYSLELSATANLGNFGTGRGSWSLEIIGG